MENVAGVLVDTDRAGRERDVVVSAVRKWDERGQRGGYGLGSIVGGDSRLIGLRDYGAVLQDALVLPQSFVTAVEKGVAFPDGTTGIATEVVALQRSLIARVGDEWEPGSGTEAAVKVVAGVESFIAEVVEGLAMEPVSAGACGYSHNGAVAASVLRAEGGVIDLELRGGADGGLEGDLVLANIVQVDAVDLEIHRVFAITGGDKGICAKTAAGRDEAARNGVGDHAPGG